MNVFSKFAKIYDDNMNVIKNTEKFTVDNYFKNKINLSKLKVKELKEIAKNNKIKITATKPILIERIQIHFKRLKNAILIQSVARRYLVKFSFHLRGPALKNRKLCVNDTDFYTLEPLSEIYHKDFYSYTDKSGFIYGFDLNSIISLLKHEKYINPYNREPIARTNINNIFSLVILNLHIYQPNINIQHNNSNTNTIIENSVHLEEIPTTLTVRQTIINKIRQCRLKPINTRIHELFIDIDYHGNYTQSSWFSDLSLSSYNRLIRTIFEIWNYRLNSLPIIRKSICPHYDPLIFELPPYNILIETIDDCRNYSLSIMENIVYGTNNIENKKLGILHILTALTVASIPARQAIPWLYESVIY